MPFVDTSPSIDNANCRQKDDVKLSIKYSRGGCEAGARGGVTGEEGGGGGGGGGGTRGGIGGGGYLSMVTTEGRVSLWPVYLLTHTHMHTHTHTHTYTHTNCRKTWLYDWR